MIDLCEEYLDSVSYSLSAVYYWDQEKCEKIVGKRIQLMHGRKYGIFIWDRVLHGVLFRMGKSKT